MHHTLQNAAPQDVSQHSSHAACGLLRQQHPEKKVFCWNIAGKQRAAHAAQQLSELAPLLSEMALAHRRLALQYLGLHKATAKLGYVATSLLAGVVAAGFCTADAQETSGNGDTRQATFHMTHCPC